MDSNFWLGTLTIIGIVGCLAGYRLYRGALSPDHELRALIRRELTLLESLPDAIIILDTRMRIRTWNPAAEAIYKFTAAEALGQDVTQLLIELPGTMYPERPTLRLSKGQTWQGRFACLDKHGKKLIISATTNILRNRRGQAIGYIAIDRNVTEQTHLEAQFMHQATLLGAVQDVVIALDRRFIITEWNHVAERLYGYAPEQAVGQVMTQLLRTEQIGEAGEGFSGRLRENGAWQGRLAHYTQAGERVIVSSAISLLFDPKGLPAGYLMIDRDITRQVGIERALEKQNIYLDTLNKTALALIDRLDLDALLETIMERAGSMVDTADACIYLWDQALGEMRVRVGIGYCRRYIGRRALPGEGLSGKVWQSNQTINVRDYPSWQGRAPDTAGDPLHAIMGLPLRSAGRVAGVLCLHYMQPDKYFDESDEFVLARFAELASIALDNAFLFEASQLELRERARVEQRLTELNADLERRVAERTEQLRNQQNQLTAILDAMGEGVIYSENNQIRYINRAMAQMTGYPVEALINQPRDLLMQTRSLKHRSSVGAVRVIVKGQTLRGTTLVQRHDKSEFEAALTLTQLSPDAQNDVLIVRDITEEVQLEGQKAQFIANASHELRTPLTNLKTRLYLINRQPERTTDHLNVIERVTNRMAQLVDDLLDVTRFEQGEIRMMYKTVCLQLLIEEVIELEQPEAQRKQITLETALPSDPVMIEGDPDRLMQVLVNLLINGINYTREGGLVRVTLRQIDHRAIIEVSDNGIGINPEHLARIFQPFFRASEGAGRGTGLGLSISREIIQLHGGQISVTSESGKGSLFSLWLPVHAPERSETEVMLSG